MLMFKKLNIINIADSSSPFPEEATELSSLPVHTFLLLLHMVMREFSFYDFA
jgi:hypothetical protein